MKVLMIAPEPFLEPRGTPISVYQRLHGLSALGHGVDLLTYHVGKDVVIPGVKIHRIPRVPFIKEVKTGPSWPKLVLDILVFFKAITMLATKRYDVIHSHEEAAFFSVILAAAFRTRHLYDMHSSLPRQLRNFDFGHYRPVVKLFKMFESWVINTCDAVITIGSDLEDIVREINPAARHIRIENLPIQTNLTAPDQRSVDELKKRLGLIDKLPIVYTGTFERYQGLGLLFESAEIVRTYHPEASFVLVGGKPEQVEYWKNEVRNNLLEDGILFVGTVPVEEVPAYLEMAEILVSPRTEGTSVPLKIYSYIHSGKPTVATKLVCHTQLLNEDTAVLAAPTEAAFAEGILRLIRDPDLRRHLGLQAQKLAKEKYDPTNYWAKLDQIYQLLQSSKGARKRPNASLKN